MAYCPLSSAVAFRCSPVATFVAVTDAPETAAPAVSVTNPVMLAVTSCADATREAQLTMSNEIVRRRSLFILVSMSLPPFPMKRPMQDRTFECAELNINRTSARISSSLPESNNSLRCACLIDLISASPSSYSGCRTCLPRLIRHALVLVAFVFNAALRSTQNDSVNKVDTSV